MKNFLEALKKAGLTEDQIAETVEAFKKDEYIPKYRLDEVSNELAESRKAVADRDTQLKSLKDLGDPAKLGEEITRLTKQNKDDAAAAAARIADISKNYAVSDFLRGMGAKDPKDIIPHMDLSKITHTDAGLLGAKEQADAIKASKAYLFDTKDENNSTGGQTGNGNAGAGFFVPPVGAAPSGQAPTVDTAALNQAFGIPPQK